MIQRYFKFSKSNSFFLFGPRGVGKTTLLGQQFAAQDSLFVDLLDLDTYDQFLLEPKRFESLLNSSENLRKRVIVDEVQRLPRLLDVVHSQIQKSKRQFILTGSSSRRLKQHGTNLLAGRAWVYHLYPLSVFELGERFDLKRALEFGGLPDAALAEDPVAAREYLNAYVGTYLQKEIQEERWVRNLAPFRKFLAVAAQLNGKIINKSKIAKDVGVDDVTVAHYFEILEDTLLGFSLPAHHASVRKAQRQMPKFYLIDTGIKRAVERTLTVELLPQTSLYGETFEHWVILEIMKIGDYQRRDWSFSYLRTKDDIEIDLIIDRPGEKKLLIEIKSKTKVSASDAKSLETLGSDLDPKAEKWILSQDSLEQKFGTTRALHWRKGLEILMG